ncbi:MAG TPA: PDR/VanB family oxidoreductase [Usitatibacter sp.]|nr:PDR/VanB family oxidoreductase [Usitatibacter sp.]
MTTYIGTTDKECGELQALVVREKAVIATDIVRFALAHPAGDALPPFSAGSHVLVITPSGLARRYSLCNSPAERDRYVIAVKREANGGGGSASMVDDVRAGTQLEVSHPFNYFPLSEEASSHLLIAGGIGITPILAMARELASRHADFRLEYCTRSAEATAFLDVLSAPEFEGRVRVHHDHGEPPATLPFAPLLAQRDRDAHLYCCGPRGLMNAVRQAALHWPSSSVHFEDFGTSDFDAPAGGEGQFVVRLARTGRDVPVPGGVSILEAIRRCGIEVPSSCESGTCGTCRTRLLEGTAEHRDFVLDEDEQRREIMICVSRARSPRLVLDL